MPQWVYSDKLFAGKVQGGRVALTAGAFRGARSRGQISFSASEEVTILNATAWKMKSIWVSPAQVISG